jgi:hypothetical protein
MERSAWAGMWRALGGVVRITEVALCVVVTPRVGSAYGVVMNRTALRAPVVALGVVAVGPLTWWLARALPDEVPADQYADYMWDPPELSVAQLLGIGLVSVVAVLSAGFVMADGIRSRTLRREWLWIVLPLAGLAGYAGLTYAVATAPVTGANIGAGLLVLGGVVVVPAMVGASLWFVRQLRSQPTR